MKKLIRIAFRNVILHWKHSLATIVCIATGFVSLVVFQGYMDDVRALYLETFRSRMMFGDVMIESKPESSDYIDTLKKDIDKSSQVKIEEYLKQNENQITPWARFLRVEGMISNGDNATIFRGVGHDVQAAAQIRGETWGWNTMYGMPLSVSQDATGIVVGQLLSRFLKCYPEKKEKIFSSTVGYKAEVRPFHCLRNDIQVTSTTESGQVNALDLNIVGIMDALYKDYDMRLVYMNLEQAQTLLSTDKITYYIMKMNHSFNADDFISKFNQWSLQNSLSIRAIRWQNHPIGDMYVRTMNLLSIFRNFVVIVILVIANLSVLNTMYKVIKERTREIGTLRSIGFSNFQLVALFFWESFFLSLIGGSIGVAFAILLAKVINLMGIVYKAGILVEPVPFKIMINPPLYLLSFIVLSVLACLTAVITTQSVLKKKIVENLSYA